MTIEITGLDRVRRNNYIRHNFDLDKPMDESLFLVQREVAQYPSAPSGSTYRRTGTLGRTWATEKRQDGDNLTGIVGNVTKYAPFVQERQRQARVHRGRWNTIEDVVEEQEQRIRQIFENYFRGIV